ncbi:MAG: relaxase/mobilization nuclease domain-containing protein [Prevotella sp.]|nr:relaxase/mobilization nuclease domain-containing protein [Prevotella sp.]
MIGKISSGQNFGTVIDYITGARDKSKKAKILLHSDGVLCEDNKTIAACLTAASLKGHHNLASPFKHISLSFSPQDAERITDDLMTRIAIEYMERMGIKDTEFVICRHHDRNHPHCHLVFSRVNNKGKLISDGNEKRRNIMVCKCLTAKYGLFMPAGKKAVNMNRLHGRDDYKYDVLLRVFVSKLRATDWNEFDEQLKSYGIKLKFHYNNVTGRVMGVSFSNGRHRYTGKQLDASLVLSKLSERFGDLHQLAHENARDQYESGRERLLRQHLYDSLGTRRIEQAFPPFDTLHPYGADGVSPARGTDLLYSFTTFGRDRSGERVIISPNRESSYISLALLVDLLLQPYQPELSIGGGGSDNNLGWRDKEDEREKFRFNFKHTKQAQHSKGRGR